ncbi:TPR end-of-group domain-containing protein [Teredinibacter turnerae]|uniref:TPR protein n=1 Tax=Teredinibacter turnerae (strain ATCC 39867 / T7901) TaxID=377629 RepID=C5BQN5_TERTT|nr:hypothetical protein [Teredinibacter turnerae]ACR10936.1 TPR protein [Teredinibacter turnerae T7901]
MSRLLTCFICLMVALPVCRAADVPSEEKRAEAVVSELNAPLYTPFIERYVLDELKSLRTEQAANKQELLQKILDREHSSVDRAVRYATDTVTYFFYLIAGVSSVLVLAGWTSIRDIKDRVHSLADEEISKVVAEYENRLAAIEAQLQQKTLHIEENREEIELTQQVQSLWLRAQQDSSPAGKIAVYNQILKIKPADCEALTYKADAVLELGEPQWAIDLCHRALEITPDNGFAHYQLACSYAQLAMPDEALVSLARAISIRGIYAKEAREDPALQPLKDLEEFIALVQGAV